MARDAALSQHLTTVLVFGVLQLALCYPPFAQAVEESPRLTDREIIEQLTRLEEGQKALGQRFETLERRVNERFDAVSREIGVMFAGMFALTGFVLWDRRTALAPAIGRVEALEKRERLLEEVLRSYALKVPELAEELRKARLL